MNQAIIVSALTVSFSLANNLCVYHNSKDQLEAELTHDLKFTELEKIKEDLSKKGITIEYLSLQFGQNKNLNKVKLAVAF